MNDESGRELLVGGSSRAARTPPPSAAQGRRNPSRVQALAMPQGACDAGKQGRSATLSTKGRCRRTTGGLDELDADGFAEEKRQGAGALQNAGANRDRSRVRYASWSAGGPPPLLQRGGGIIRTPRRGPDFKATATQADRIVVPCNCTTGI